MSKQKKNNKKKDIQKNKKTQEIKQEKLNLEEKELKQDNTKLEKEPESEKQEEKKETDNRENTIEKEIIEENITKNNDETEEVTNTKKVEQIAEDIDNPENRINSKENKDNKIEVNEIKTDNNVKKDLVINKEKSVTKIKEENKKQKNKKKRKIIYIVLGIIIFILAIMSVIFSLININNNDIISGVSIKGINVSGMSKEEAKQNIEKVTKEKLLKTIKLIDGDYKVDLNPKDIEASFNVDKAVEEAYNIGRDGNIIVNNYKILMAQLFKKDVNLDFTLNEERLLEIITDTSLKLPGTVVQSSYYIEDDELIITKGTAGERIKADELKREIYNNIEDLNVGDKNLNIPTEIVEP